MRFLCGCEMPSLASLRGDLDLQTFDTVEFDGQNFIICSVHKQRRYGWRTPSHGPRAFHGLTELQVETVEIFGVDPAEIQGIGSYVFFAPTVEDRRDNRDPRFVEYETELRDLIPEFPRTSSEDWREFMVRQRQALLT